MNKLCKVLVKQPSVFRINFNFNQSNIKMFEQNQNQLIGIGQIRGVKKLEDRKEDQEKKAFQNDIQFMISKESWTLHDFKEKVDQGLANTSNVKQMFMQDETEKKSLEKQQKICAALTEEEMNGEIQLTREDKREVAEVTQCTVEDVHDTLAKFK